MYIHRTYGRELLMSAFDAGTVAGYVCTFVKYLWSADMVLDLVGSILWKHFHLDALPSYLCMCLSTRKRLDEALNQNMPGESPSLCWWQ
jgi:hypothetical protein